MSILIAPGTQIAGDALARARRARRIDQREIAEYLGITRQVISQIETNPRPTWKAISKYLQALEAIEAAEDQDAS